MSQNLNSRSATSPLSNRILACGVLFLFGIVWPADLFLQYHLARSGHVVTGQVEETSERRAKSGQIIYYSTVSYPAWEMTFRRTLSGPELKIGAQTPVQYAPLLPLYAVLSAEPQEEPRRVTIFMRLFIGALFSGIGILILFERGNGHT